MARPKALIPTYPEKVHLEQDVYLKMKLVLHSPTIGGIPHGAKSRLVNEALRQYFANLKDTECTPPNKNPD